MRRTGVMAAVFGFLAVALGAFGAHALRDRLEPRLMEIFHTGVTYQFYHALALGWLALLKRDSDGRALKWAGRFFVIGIVVFSGSLYLLALTGMRKFGMITPIGGLAFLAGWGALVVYFYGTS